MLEYITPEEAGVSSAAILKYLRLLEKAQLSTHSIVMIRHGKIFYENYWKPFHKDFLHRMYSVSKSFAGLAIGFALQDGLIDLDAPITAYLDYSLTEHALPNMKKQTIRNMLMMCTGVPSVKGLWFDRHPEDRLQDYFNGSLPIVPGSSKTPGTIFAYDTAASIALGAVVAAVTGKPLLDYLREKLFDKIGVSKEAYFLTVPGGHAYSDSALMCTTQDLARTVLFTLNGGKWNGEQLLSEDYIRAATSNLVDTGKLGFALPSAFGYGYQIWRTYHNSIFFNGMGSQFGIGVPDQNIVFVINSDNQGHPHPHCIIIDRFFEEIVETASDVPLPEDPTAYTQLMAYSEQCSLFALKDGIADSALHTVQQSVNGREYILQANPMGITSMKFTFGETCRLEYTNAQGAKALSFGMEHNVFGKFPEENCPSSIGNVPTPGYRYDCAASARWTHERSLAILVQFIDVYMGRIFIRVNFREDNGITVMMEKAAHGVQIPYEGVAEGSFREL